MAEPLKFFIKTFGCQMNVNDSEKMASILARAGFRAAARVDDAGIIVVNSCAVRQKSEEKMYSYLGRLPRQKIIVAAGCVSQIRPENLRQKFPHLSLVLGTHQFHRIGDLVKDLIENSPPASSRLAFDGRWREVRPDEPFRSEAGSAYISIMEGCNNFCSYCVVPFTRGREKFRPLKHILREADAVSREGIGEIILLGQNVNSWRDPVEKIRFPQLLEILAREVPVNWIRFITSYPGYHADEIIGVMRDYPRIARHIHFPAQSGSTRILKKMNRRYTRRDYLRIIERFTRAIPAIRFSSDFIVGFPGETRHDFDLTLSLIRNMNYESIFSFVYSPRTGTAGYHLRETLTLQQKKERLQRLQALQASIQLSSNQKLVGQTLPVLIKKRNPRNPQEMVGRTETMKVVNFISQGSPGTMTRVRITGASPHAIQGVEA